jgi:hypothetical protein
VGISYAMRLGHSVTKKIDELESRLADLEKFDKQ